MTVCHHVGIKIILIILKIGHEKPLCFRNLVSSSCLHWTLHFIFQSSFIHNFQDPHFDWTRDKHIEVFCAHFQNNCLFISVVKSIYLLICLPLRNRQGRDSFKGLSTLFPGRIFRPQSICIFMITLRPITLNVIRLRLRSDFVSIHFIGCIRSIIYHGCGQWGAVLIGFYRYARYES